MKPIKKNSAKLFIVLIAFALVVGILFAFIPMGSNEKSFLSLAGSIKTSSDIGGGVYAEYDLDDVYSETQINKSINTIKNIMEDKGFAGSNIFSVDDKKIRIEIGYPIKSSSLKDSYKLLSAVGVGVFELGSSSKDEDVLVVGKKHVKSVDVKTYNSTIYVVINFNSKGKEAYKQLLEKGDTIYVRMGGNTMTSFNASNASATNSLSLSFAEYDSAKDFAMKVRLGSMPVGLVSDTVEINTMSGSLDYGNISANPNNKNFSINVTNIVGMVVIMVVVLLGIAYMIWKFGVIGAFNALALAFDAIIAVILMWLIPQVEISFSSLIAILFGFGILLATSIYFASLFVEEYSQGKTVSASFESAFKKSLKAIIASGVALVIIFAIVAIVASAELRVFGLITIIFSCLSLFSTLIMLPGFIKIFEAFNDGASKPYRLPKREEE